MTDASDRGWGSGWPASRLGDMVPVRVDGADFPAGVHRDIHDLVEILLTESVERGYIRLRDGWCWGYANRAIKTASGGTTNIPSNHSWGLAVDINAPENCFGCSTHTIPTAMAELWIDYGFGWGGYYSGSKDWMHFEFLGTPTNAATITARAREDLMQDERLDQFDNGFDAYRDRYKKNGGVDPGEPPQDKPAWFKKGWAAARFSGTNPHGE